MSNMCKTSGGKGNVGMFITRDPKICAAGMPSSQPNVNVSDGLQRYLLQDAVDALIGDSIKPAEKCDKLLPLRRPMERDMRNAGLYGEAADLINPPIKTKFQTLTEDFKETVYSSYWKKSVGNVSDPVPTLPIGFDILTTLGKKLPPCESLYDVVMPKVPLLDKTQKSKEPGQQKDRKYCLPSYNPNNTFGLKTNLDPSGKFVKNCLTYDNIIQGTHLKKPINTTLANFKDERRSQLGVATTPNNNINCVPKGFTFGKSIQNFNNVEECMVTCELNPNRELFKQCLSHLNTVRKCLAKRFESTFFQTLYLSLRYHDNNKTGWIPKETVYKYCNDKLIKIIPSLIEPLLCMWNAFDGFLIEYKTFVSVINFTKVPPELPKVLNIPEDCTDFKTSYTEMVKPGQYIDQNIRAGLPSGRYLDIDYPITPQGFCKADRSYLPEESDARACLCPSVFTLLGISHRDLYAKREPETIRRVFEAAGEQFDDEKFNYIWNGAKKYHSQGWVSYETFQRSINEINSQER